MLSALLDIVIPVFAVAGLGALYGRLRGGAELGYINRANIELFSPALVFSALVKYCNRPLRMKKPGAAENKWDLVG
ncbi:hypothetical protein Aeroheme_02177 [Aeromonas sp. DSM 116730]